MKYLRWLLGSIVIIGIIVLVIISPFAFLIRCLFILILASFLCLFRIIFGPTAPDRAVGVDILGILIVGFCAILSISTGRSWYIDIGIAWALQSFIATLALAKYLEKRGFEE